MTPAENITRHFGGEWQGSQGAFPSPGHSKSYRGTTVKDTDDGDVVFYSHNGGDWRAVKDECRRLGLIPNRTRQRDGGDIWREIGRYEYVDADGTTAYRTVRKEKFGERKRFVVQRPDGQGGWANVARPPCLEGKIIEDTGRFFCRSTNACRPRANSAGAIVPVELAKAQGARTIRPDRILRCQQKRFPCRPFSLIDPSAWLENPKGQSCAAGWSSH